MQRIGPSGIGRHSYEQGRCCRRQRRVHAQDIGEADAVEAGCNGRLCCCRDGTERCLRPAGSSPAWAEARSARIETADRQFDAPCERRVKANRIPDERSPVISLQQCVKGRLTHRVSIL